jgi:Cu(I)-responsive transcriptional regulator
MNIGEAAAAAGVSAKMVRHYERSGLLPAATRRANGYRSYGDDDIAALRFIRRARDLGVPLADAAALLAFRRNETPSRDVKALAVTHIADLERRMADMASMVAGLRRLADACPGNESPTCPILAALDSPGLNDDARGSSSCSGAGVTTPTVRTPSSAGSA